MYNNGNTSKNVTGASVVDGSLENADFADNGISGDKIDGGTISGLTGIGFSGGNTPLDDYEEGAWTPILDVQSGTSPSYTVTEATYTKTGNIVTAYAKLSISAAGSGLLRVSFPFVPSSSKDSYGTAKIKDNSNVYRNLIIGSYNTARALFTQEGSTSYFYNADGLSNTMTIQMQYETN
jgi:hypothetical protein